MEITFREIVKLIHPDSNPLITNPSEKMNDVLLNRANKMALWNLAVRWGLIDGIENNGVSVGVSNITIRVSNTGWDTGYHPTYGRNPEYWSTYWEV